MEPLLALCNHLLAAALAERDTFGAVRVARVELAQDGLLLHAHLFHAQWRGEALLRLVAEPPEDGRQRLRLTVERWPETLPAALEPLRSVLERARLILELDFSAS